jgi:putative RNA 2'-phosphotransferase
VSKNQTAIKLDKFLSYVLGRRPDEFGLVPDSDGYVKIRDLLKAVNEEEGGRHVRSSSIDEVLITLPCPSIEVKDQKIRAVSRESLFSTAHTNNPPKLLYTCVRQKGYPYVLKNGLSPLGHYKIILADNPEFAKKMGKRIDPKPVTLTVHVQNALDRGISFEKAGNLFLADFIPPDCLTGPPLPKEKTEAPQTTVKMEKKPEHLPGGFLINLDDTAFNQNPYRQKKKGSESYWKKDRKRLRKEKHRPWLDQ